MKVPNCDIFNGGRGNIAVKLPRFEGVLFSVYRDSQGVYVKHRGQRIELDLPAAVVELVEWSALEKTPKEVYTAMQPEIQKMVSEEVERRLPDLVTEIVKELRKTAPRGRPRK